MVSELQETLRKLGFSQYYSDILIYLSNKKQAQNAKELSEGSRVPLARIYSILIDLENRGLIKTIPGKVRLYKIPKKKELIRTIESEKSKELQTKKLEVEKALEILNSSIKQKPEEEVRIRYFVKDSEYWGAYEEARDKLQPRDKFYIINSIRLCPSFLLEELDQNPKFRKIILNLQKKEDIRGLKQHYVIDVEALIQRIRRDLPEKEKFIESIKKMLSYLGKYKQNYQYTLLRGMRNILVAITKDSVFFEFYEKTSTTISSAIQIQSRKVAKDFQLWFESLTKGEHDPEKDYEKFKEEVLKEVERQTGIREEEIF